MKRVVVLAVAALAAITVAGCGGGGSTTTLASGRQAKQVAQCLHTEDSWQSQVGASATKPHLHYNLTAPPENGQPGPTITLTDEDPQNPVQYTFRIAASDGHAVDVESLDLTDSQKSAIYACAAQS